MRWIIIFSILFFSGCSSNLAGFGEWWNPTTLIDARGRAFEGKVKFDWVSRDGTIEIPATAYGDIKGYFSTRTPDVNEPNFGLAGASAGGDSITVPALGSQAIEVGKEEGTAYLAVDNTVVMKCNIGVDYQSKGMSDTQMIGGGICADKDGNLSQIYFGR